MKTTGEFGAGAGNMDNSNLFLNRSLNEVISRSRRGYSQTSGMHIYCELRPTDALRAPESDAMADVYLQVVQTYVHLGIAASRPFHVELLEVQNNILHFYRESELNESAALEAIQFVAIFTKAVYEELKSTMKPEHWHGFASCMDYGQCIIINNGATASSSTVSLGPAANRPAKRLLSGNTPAGCLDIPGAWAQYLPQYAKRSEWITITLSDRELGEAAAFTAGVARRAQFLEAIQNSRRSDVFRNNGTVLLANRQHYGDPETFSVDRPYRMEAFCLRCDLDGFSSMVELAFHLGSDAVETLARGFGEIIELAESFRRSVPGCISLPWAGDCVTFLVPPLENETLAAFRESRWLQVAVQWQQTSLKDIRSTLARSFQNASWSGWAIGAACGDSGLCLVAPIETTSRRFLIAAGWSVGTALKAQERGKGNDVVIKRTEHAVLPKRTRQFFRQIEDSEYWKASHLTSDKLAKADIEAGKSENQSPARYLVSPNIHIPTPKPHFRA